MSARHVMPPQKSAPALWEPKIDFEYSSSAPPPQFEMRAQEHQRISATDSYDLLV